MNHVDAMRRRYTYISAALIALSLIAVALYGNRMLREVLAIGELQRANAAFEDAIEGVAIVDKQKNYTYANRAFARRDGDIIR